MSWPVNAPLPTGRLEVVLAPLALLLLGLVSAAVVPPGQTPDEGFSFLRAYHVADGYLRPELVDGWGGGRFPPGVVRIVECAPRLIDRPDEKFTAGEWRELAALGWDGEPRSLAYYTAAPYTFVPYLPPATGIRAGRALGMGPLGVFYAGRVANLLFGTALVAVAIALAPAGRRFLGLVALLPMTVHLFGSYAPEVGVVGAALLLPAMALRLAVATGRTAALWELAVIGAAVAWVGACKPPYLSLAAFVCVVPAARLGGRVRWAAAVAAVFALGGVIGLSGVESARPYYADPNTIFGVEVSVRGQTEFVKRNPERFAVALAEGVVVRAVPTYFRLFKLGWLDTPINPAAVVLFSAVVVLLAAAGRAELDALGRAARWPAGLAVFGSLVLASLSLYIWCAPVGGSVAGLHGRYLLPLVPAALVLVPGRVPRLLASVRAQRFVSWWAAGLISAVAIAAVVSRYYLAATPALLRGPSILALGLGVALVVHFDRRLLLSALGRAATTMRLRSNPSRSERQF